MSQHSYNAQRLDRERRAFWARKLFSLTGVAPLGVFVVVYLWTSARAMQGREVFDAALRDWETTPYALVLELLLFWAPFLFHALLGLKILTQARPSLRRAPYAGQWTYILQRVSALVALALVVYHGYRFRHQSVFGRGPAEDLFPELCARLSATSGGMPWLALFYLVGLAALVFHLCNGLHGFCFSWGVTASRRAGRIASAAFGVFGVGLYVVSASTVIYFATGSRIALVTPKVFDELPAITCRDALQTDDGEAASASVAARGATEKRPQQKPVE